MDSNGVQIFSPADFNQQVGATTRNVILGADNTLVVTLGGKPESFAVISVALEAAVPQPAVTLQITPTSVVAGEQATLSWTTKGAIKVFLEPEIGEVPASGTLSVSPAQTTLYRLVAEGPGGETTAEAILTVNAATPTLGIVLDPYQGIPLAGATIPRHDLTISGKVVVENPGEIGIIAQGMLGPRILGHSDGNRFVINKIPLLEGPNTISISATDSGGKGYETSVQVFCLPATQSVSLSTEAEAGLAPFQVEMTAQINLPDAVSSYSLICEGPARVTAIPSSDNSLIATLDQPGLYTCALKIVDERGAVHGDQLEIEVYSKESLDALLHEKWRGLTAAMAEADIEAALTFISDGMREVYRRKMSGMVSTLPQIVGEMQSIRLFEVENGWAVYELRISRNGTIYSQQLEFMQDEDGIWRIRAF